MRFSAGFGPFSVALGPAVRWRRRRAARTSPIISKSLHARCSASCNSDRTSSWTHYTAKGSFRLGNYAQGVSGKATATQGLIPAAISWHYWHTGTTSAWCTAWHDANCTNCANCTSCSSCTSEPSSDCLNLEQLEHCKSRPDHCARQTVSLVGADSKPAAPCILSSCSRPRCQPISAERAEWASIEPNFNRHHIIH